MANNLREELDKIALEIAEGIQNDECPLDVRLDAFKVLSAYHLGLMKKGADKPKDEGDRPTFGDLRKKIAAAS